MMNEWKSFKKKVGVISLEKGEADYTDINK
jgi:hypothetical protein